MIQIWISNRDACRSYRIERILDHPGVVVWLGRRALVIGWG